MNREFRFYTKANAMKTTKIQRAEAEAARQWKDLYAGQTPEPVYVNGDKISSFRINNTWPVDIFMNAFWLGYDFAEKDARRRKKKNPRPKNERPNNIR